MIKLGIWKCNQCVTHKENMVFIIGNKYRRNGLRVNYIFSIFLFDIFNLHKLIYALTNKRINADKITCVLTSLLTGYNR